MIITSINEYLTLTYEKAKTSQLPRERIKCVDGFTMSVQVSRFHYCSPRIDFEGPYDMVEIGYPSEIEEDLSPYAEDKEDLLDTVYIRVPVELVDEIIIIHGGIVFNQSESMEKHTELVSPVGSGSIILSGPLDARQFKRNISNKDEENHRGQVLNPITGEWKWL